MTKIARFVHSYTEWVSLLAKIEEEGPQETVPAFVLASLVPTEADGGREISVFEIESNDLAGKLAAAFKFKAPVERCAIVVADKESFVDVGLALNVSSGDTGFPEVDKLHRDLDVSTSEKIIAAAKIFMNGEIIPVEKKSIELIMEKCARSNEIDFKFLSNKPNNPFKEKSMDYLKRGIIRIHGVSSEQ